MNDAITPFTLAVPQADLEDLNRRIDQTRWPDAETVDDWTQGAPLAKVKALVDHCTGCRATPPPRPGCTGRAWPTSHRPNWPTSHRPDWSFP